MTSSGSCVASPRDHVMETWVTNGPSEGHLGRVRVNLTVLKHTIRPFLMAPQRATLVNASSRIVRPVRS